MTLHVHPIHRGVPRFLAGFHGFQNMNAKLIRRAIIDAFCADEPLHATALLLNGREPNVSQEAMDTARSLFNNLVVSLHKYKSGPHVDKIVANVYCEPPTTDETAWTGWRQKLREIPIEIFSDTTGIARGSVRCTGCHGGDHLLEECPFATIPGWEADLTLPADERRDEPKTQAHAHAHQQQPHPNAAPPHCGHWKPQGPREPHEQYYNYSVPAPPPPYSAKRHAQQNRPPPPPRATAPPQNYSFQVQVPRDYDQGMYAGPSSSTGPYSDQGGRLIYADEQNTRRGGQPRSNGGPRPAPPRPRKNNNHPPAEPSYDDYYER